MDFEIRDRTVNRGRKKLRREREEYFRLMQLGYSNKEACRVIGINLRTGREWRNGRTGPNRTVAPAHAPRTPRSTSSRYLREDERFHIADRLREKATVRAVAAELGRSPSTVSREIRRNGMLVRKGSSRWVYRPYAAQSRADARRPRPKPGKIGQNPELRDFVQDHLVMRWSPEQICQALRTRFPDRPEMHVTHETIYQALYVQGRGELRRELTKALRTGRARRRPHRQSAKRQPRAIKNMVMISDRPAEADDRAVPGHREGDLIVGTESKSAIGTLVERTTRYVMPVHLPTDHTAPNTRDALIETVNTLPAHLRRSLTWDQGPEMAAHQAFTIAPSACPN